MSVISNKNNSFLTTHFICTVYKVINGSKKLLDDDLRSCQRVTVVNRGAFEVNTTTSDRPLESVRVLVVPANETNCDELLLLRLTSSNKCPTYKECERLTESSTSKNCGFLCQCRDDSCTYEIISSVEQGTSVCELMFVA